MIKRLAIFVEGLTEQEFVIQLLKEIAGRRQITLEIRKQSCGHLTLVEIQTQPSPDFYILVVNCCNDDQVKSQIIDQHASLKAAGYSMIIGLRDVYPFQHSDITKLQSCLYAGLPVDHPSINLHLAIMEVEAWFLEEINHFKNIDPKITESELVNNGFDININLASDLPHPAETLDNIYKAVGKRYIKDKKRIQRTVNALSYEELYINVRSKSTSFDGFLTSIEHGLFC
ncbi:DUF4276 family protein [Geobacter sp. FeAm09]|uniref:DUF4276 family protein n=1 Tax=Geobacter sp. FeAm09 TaxID=2597769 RepID=UPI0011EEF1A5|nr:DUF4276 family protein [Geobacter sp. FeAm09]QEM68235.1 DUF4276 family protein [Geobacter sp. FeAm09]